MENFITGLSLTTKRVVKTYNLIHLQGFLGANSRSETRLLRCLGKTKHHSSLTRCINPLSTKQRQHTHRDPHQFLEYFFEEPDAVFFKSLGLNCIRIAINYRHFEDDMNPRTLRPNCFKHLDRVVSLCAAQGIYTILDMHTAPGGQNNGWHSDHGTHVASFWIHKDFQDRLIWLWTEIATHYKDEKWIAGYNPMNEPADPQHKGLIAYYDEVHAAIRSADPNHILFFDGNTFAMDFSRFPDDAASRWPNSAYSIHDYSVYGFPSAPEPFARTEEQKEKMRRSYEKKREWMDKRGLCVWNGEWGPVYARQEHDGDATDEINERRFDVLQEQLDMYHKVRVVLGKKALNPSPIS